MPRFSSWSPTQKKGLNWELRGFDDLQHHLNHSLQKANQIIRLGEDTTIGIHDAMTA
jgi:hypothetical protein